MLKRRRNSNSIRKKVKNDMKIANDMILVD